ncbi:MAG: leucine-rich repeat protein [Clostridia bacterium]|nr:leucine-rich repeat protein [Clostridia bacterium]
MKKLFKAWLSVTLAAIFVFGLFPFADISIANAADAVYGDYTYTVDEKKKTAEITGRSGSALDLSLPLKIGEYTVTSVADGAFKDTPVLKVTIPDSVTEIGSEAFANCAFLNSVIIGNGTKTIGVKAFYNCNALSSFAVTLANSAFTTVDGVLFSKAKTTLVAYPTAKGGTNYDIPSGVTSVYNYAFSKAKNLTSVSVPKSVSSINAYAFAECPNLSSIDFSRASGLKVIGEHAFYACKKLSSATLPATVNDLGKGAFKNCSALASVSLPSKLQKVSDELFSGCEKLKDLSMYSGITAIGVSSFENCKALVNIIIPDSVIRIGSKAFSGCSGVTAVSIGSGLGAFDPTSFSGCSSLQSYSIGDNKSYSVSDGILFDKAGTKLISYPPAKLGGAYTVPSNVTSIGSYAFDSCKHLVKLTVPATVKTIAKPAVVNCPSLAVYVDDGSAAESYFTANKSGIASLKISGNSARIEPRSLNITAGQSFDVPIEILNNPGLTAAAFTVSFDITKLKYVGHKDAKLLNGCRIKTNTLGNVITISYADSSATTDVTASGTLITLTFEPLSTFTSGTTAISIKVDKEETYNSKLQAVSLKTNDGIISVGGAASSSMPGDVDSNGDIDARDVMLLTRYVSNEKNISIDKDAADVDNDGAVTSKDVMILTRYDAGWKGVTLI